MSRKFWITAVAVGVTTVSVAAWADDYRDGIRYDDRYDSLPGPRERPGCFRSTTMKT